MPSANRFRFFVTFTAHMKAFGFISLVVLLLAGMHSCFYTDTSIYEAEPIAGDPPIVFISTNLDTMFVPPVNDSLEVLYEVEVIGGLFYYMYADLGPEPVFESDSSTGSFWITPILADSIGVDTLIMEFYYSTNSNSLADKVGIEAQVKQLKFAVDFNLPGGK